MAFCQQGGHGADGEVYAENFARDIETDGKGSGGEREVQTMGEGIAGMLSLVHGPAHDELARLGVER